MSNSEHATAAIRQRASRPPWKTAPWWANWVLAILAMLLLNSALNFNNIWPTPIIIPDARISPEFVMLWVLLLVMVRLTGVPARWVLGLLAAAYVILFLGRYLDVTAPSLFGRQVNLYWDGHQLPRFLTKAAQSFSVWQLIAMVVGIVLGLWLLYRLFLWAIRILASIAAPASVGSPPALLATALALVVVIANYNGVSATWPYVSKPVMPTYARQVDILLTAFLPSRLAKVLPESPAFDTNLHALNGADVLFLMSESYGAVTYDKPEFAAQLKAPREAFLKAATDAGYSVSSAYFTAATIGGASELTHLSFLSGIDLSNPIRHDVLLTTERPTMVGLFKRHGYQTIGAYPALSWDWPEKSFYDFDTFVDGPALNYSGPKLGLWWIPDQFTMARLEERYPTTGDRPSRMLFFPTITSHAPFRPTPPLQQDWPTVLTDEPFDPEETAAAMSEKIDWSDTYSGYTSTIAYSFAWLSSYISLPRERPQFLVVIGDHQPMGTVTGPNPRWEVPVHVVSHDQSLSNKLVEGGFQPGMTPQGDSVGGMHDLGALLLQAFHRPLEPPLAKKP